MKSLKVTMYVIVVYLAIIGVLYLFFPGIAETAFKITLSDRGTAMLHGFGNLIMAFLIYTTASDLDNYSKLVRVYQAFALGETLIFVYQLYVCRSWPANDHLGGLHSIPVRVW